MAASCRPSDTSFRQARKQSPAVRRSREWAQWPPQERPLPRGALQCVEFTDTDSEQVALHHDGDQAWMGNERPAKTIPVAHQPHRPVLVSRLGRAYFVQSECDGSYQYLFLVAEMVIQRGGVHLQLGRQSSDAECIKAFFVDYSQRRLERFTLRDQRNLRARQGCSFRRECSAVRGPDDFSMQRIVT